MDEPGRTALSELCWMARISRGDAEILSNRARELARDARLLRAEARAVRAEGELVLRRHRRLGEALPVEFLESVA